jgi:F-type H+-transporting ATPase subunit c
MRVKVLLTLAALAVAAPMFGQEAAGAAASGGFTIPAKAAMAIASGLCGLGQGKAIAASAEGMARNPGAAGAIRITMLLGLAFIESLALFTFIS